MFEMSSRRPARRSALLAGAVLCVVSVLPLQGQSSHENWSGWSTLEGQLMSSAPAAAQNNDGRLEVFIRNAAGLLYRSAQVSPGSATWTNWTALETGHVGNPVAIRDSRGRLWVFVRGANGVLWRKWQGVPGGQWSSWYAFDGAIEGDPAVVLFQDRLHVFVRGTAPQNALYYKAQGSSQNDFDWSAWVHLGGVLRSNPAVVVDGPRLEVFVRGSDDGLHYRTWSGAWSSWTRLGSLLVQSDPAVATNGSQVDVIARSTDQRLWRAFRNAQQPWGAASWISLGGPSTTSDPVIGVNDDGRMEIFVRGADGTVYHNYQDSAGGSYGNWTSLGGIPAADTDIAVSRNLDGRLQIFIRASDSLLDHNAQVVPGG